MVSNIGKDGSFACKKERGSSVGEAAHIRIHFIQYFIQLLTVTFVYTYSRNITNLHY